VRLPDIRATLDHSSKARRTEGNQKTFHTQKRMRENQAHRNTHHRQAQHHKQAQALTKVGLSPVPPPSYEGRTYTMVGTNPTTPSPSCGNSAS
jgi:hypothetical protein